MPRLQTPICKQLDSSVPEADVRRLWLAIAERRQRLAKRPTWFSSAYARSAAAVLAVAAVLLVWRYSATPPRVVDEAALGPLLMTNGHAPTTLDAKAQDTVTLVDGSRIELRPSSKLEVLDNDGRRFVSVLRHGTAHFEVKPGGRRRWTVEAGLAAIEVVGTGFTIRRGEQDLEVSVAHGTVIVRGHSVPDQVQRLSAGERLVVGGPSEVSPALPPAVPAPSNVPIADEPQGVAGHPAVDRLPTTTNGTPRERAARWLAEADRARRAGNVDRAIEALRFALVDADGSQAALTSFTLGKLLLDGAGRPVEAEQAFARCLALRPPATLAEDALARLVEAQARAGRSELSRATAAEYERLYPAGRRLAEVRHWASEP